MLRQVILYYNQERIFTYNFAKGYDKTTLEILFTKRLSPFIENPIEAKISNKPMFDLQAHFGNFNNVFYLFVTDLADRPRVIAKEIKRAASLFHKNFPKPETIKEDSPEKDEFTVFIQETHYFLHPKIALMGPMNSGKSTIVNYLKLSDSPDKKIMNFAEYFKIKLGKNFFDLWDFIQNDNFSPLWNNFIRGSDLIFFILNGSASKLNEHQIQFFHNLKRRDGKFSNWVVLLTHQDEYDFVGVDNFKAKFKELGKINVYEIDLTSTDAGEELKTIFREVMGLKQPLPASFKTQLIEANRFVQETKFEKAIAILKKLSDVAREYQEFKYLEVINNKVIELDTKLTEERKRKEREAKRIKAPSKISFGSFKGPKSINGKLSLPSMKSLPGNLKAPPSPVLNHTSDAKDLKVEDFIPNNGAHLNQKSNENEMIEDDALPPLPTLDETALDSSLLSDLESENPFFQGITPQQEEHLTPKESKPSFAQSSTLTPKKSSSSGLTPKKPKKEEESPKKIEHNDLSHPNTSSSPPFNLTPKKKTQSSNSVPFTLTPKKSAQSPPVKAPMNSMQQFSSSLSNIQAPPKPKMPPKFPFNSPQKPSTEPMAPLKTGAPIEEFEIKIHKVDPIDLDELDKKSSKNRHTELAELLMEKSLSKIKSGQTRDKKLTFERSPLVSQTLPPSTEKKEKVQIPFMKSSGGVKKKRNPLEMFTLNGKDQEAEEPVQLNDGERLGLEIRALGESLTQELCEKFIHQVKVHLKKTNLTDEDIKKAASLYVLQRRKMQG